MVLDEGDFGGRRRCPVDSGEIKGGGSPETVFLSRRFWS